MAHHDDSSPLTNDVLYCLANGLLEDDLGQSLLRIWDAGVIDERTAGMIRERVRKDAFKHALSGMPFREPRFQGGQFVLGLDTTGRAIHIPLQYLNAHFLTVANTGAGKTTAALFYALQVAPRVRGMWLLDLRKREFRALRPYLARLGIDLVVLPARSMRINPLQVPLGVTPADWAARVSDMLVQVLGLPPRATKLCQTLIFKLYRKFGVFESSRTYPTIFHLLEATKEASDANPQARLALIDSLTPVLLSLGPEVLAYSYGWTSTDLAKRHLAIEFAGIGEVEKNLLLNSLILAEFTSRVAQSVSNPTMNFWICCDEAQRLCGTTGGGLGQGGAISDLVGMIRGTGIGLHLSVLSASELAPQILSNTATKVMGRCGSAADYVGIGHSMGLSSEEIQWAQLHLKPGLFIGQLGEGGWRRPFVFTVPAMHLSPEARDEGGSQDLGQLPALPAKGA